MVTGQLLDCVARGVALDLQHKPVRCFGLEPEVKSKPGFSDAAGAGQNQAQLIVPAQQRR